MSCLCRLLPCCPFHSLPFNTPADFDPRGITGDQYNPDIEDENRENEDPSIMTAFLRGENRESVKDRQETETNIKGDGNANLYGDILLVERADVPRMATVVYGGIDTASPDALGTPSDIENMPSRTFETKI
jgi:hypothetical protein